MRTSRCRGRRPGPDHGPGGPSGHEAYDEDVWGGECTLGELGSWRVPDGAEVLTFWLRAVHGGRAAGPVTVDLAAGTANGRPPDLRPTRAAESSPPVTGPPVTVPPGTGGLAPSGNPRAGAGH